MTSVLEQIEDMLGGDSDSDAAVSTEAAWQLVSVGSGVLAGVMARKVLKRVWPASEEHGGLIAATQWAIASGIAVGVARTFAQRAVGHAWERATGSPPPSQAS